MFSPSPCPRHYPRLWTTMASADFCILTIPIAQSGAVFHHFLSVFFLRISQTGRTFPVYAGIFGNRNPTGNFTGNNFILHGIQISPNKSVNFRYASASFTVSPVPGRNHVVLTDPETRPYMIFLFVTPYLCHPASFRPYLTVTPLPLASNLCYVSQRYMEHLQGTLTPLVHAHVGRTPGV
ncbi:hypothetical protein UWK_02232 [Desulfocapsa sulfexigens DSM 10523]|uniref:Uncharacterized protein n=1 Tax=Desulfocapsa sulfexigens (strain DSM 10523 / SB164P1) TaxID=1167006 RepID=M1P5K1_DESSD|nr:hypothetical protein UWK_02232 [Desulfocapsa sulfexigens DSM 10523]